KQSMGLKDIAMGSKLPKISNVILQDLESGALQSEVSQLHVDLDLPRSLFRGGRTSDVLRQAILLLMRACLSRCGHRRCSISVPRVFAALAPSETEQA